MDITPNPLLQETASQQCCAPPLAAPEQQRYSQPGLAKGKNGSKAAHSALTPAVSPYIYRVAYCSYFAIGSFSFVLGWASQLSAGLLVRSGIRRRSRLITGLSNGIYPNPLLNRIVCPTGELVVRRFDKLTDYRLRFQIL